MGIDEFGQFRNFAGADVRGEVNVVAFLSEFANDGGTGGFGEATDFIARVVAQPGAVGEGNGNEDGLFATDGELVTLGLERFADGEAPWGYEGIIRNLSRGADLPACRYRGRPGGLPHEKSPPEQLDCSGGPGVQESNSGFA